MKKLAVGFFAPGHNVTAWELAFAQHGIELSAWPNWDDLKVALVWQPTLEVFQKQPGIELIISLGAGVDHILRLGSDLPKVPIVRMADDELIDFMCSYVTMAVLSHHRNLPQYLASQENKQWLAQDPVHARDRRIGFLGFGNMAIAPAKLLGSMGHPIVSWSRSPKKIADVISYHGMNQLNEFLSNSDILVCILPATPETDGLLNMKHLMQLPSGAAIINVGRGNVLRLEDLVLCLDNDHLSGATLDVFDEEPLPKQHFIWSHPRVQVTPHIASPSLPASVAAYVGNILRQFIANQPLDNQVNLMTGY